MYRPDHFRVDDIAQMHALMRARPLAALVSAGPSGLYATHLPVVLKAEGEFGAIECHLARANPHWKDLAEGGEAMMIFQGPEAYITPNWYASKAETGKVVPTWNYAVVQAYGTMRVMDDEAWLRTQIGDLTQLNEAARTAPWAVTDAPKAFVDAMVRGIIGLEIEIARIEGKWKVSQNRPEADREGVVEGLRAEADERADATAELVEAFGAKG